MSNPSKTRLAVSIVGVALVLGLLADLLLRGTPWGINVSLWIVCLLAGLFWAKGQGGVRMQFGSLLLMAPMAVFGICFAWRDSATLRALDWMAIIVSAALVITRQTAPFWAPTLGRMFQSVFNLAGHCLAGFVHLVARDIDWSQQRSGAVAANARGAAVGVLMAIPMLIIFTVLFVRADAAFENFFNGVMSLKIADHILPLSLGTWIAGSYLRGALIAPHAEPPPLPIAISDGVKLGSMELNVALGLLNALFATFVAVQAQYLFGTAQMVTATPGMTFSSYARRGFFELVTVALLVLPILLCADAWHAKEKSKRALRIQSLVLVGFVLCIMASAMHRMRLYQVEYGLTELRWYTVAFMIWLAFVFVLFCVTVLREARPLFAVGVLASGFMAIFVLHALNPDARIAAVNIANARAGKPFDADYLRKLSADAAPVVMENQEVIADAPLREFVEHQRANLAKQEDWRAWNYGRAKARGALDKSGF